MRFFTTPCSGSGTFLVASNAIKTPSFSKMYVLIILYIAEKNKGFLSDFAENLKYPDVLSPIKLCMC